MRAAALPACDQTYAPNFVGAVAPAAAEAAERLRGFTNASPHVVARQVAWHQRGADLIDRLDAMLARRRGAVEPLLASAEAHVAEARAILAAIRAALAEVRQAADPLGEAVARVTARLPPLAPAAAEAVCDLSEAEVSAVRALKVSPPATVRVVVTSACTLLRAPGDRHTSLSARNEADGAAGLASWEDARAMLARPDFAKALKGFDPRTLHARPHVASLVRRQLSELAHAGGPRRSSAETQSRPWRRMAQARSAPTRAPSSVAETTMMLHAAVRGGGRAVGQLYLWCSRVLAEAADLEERDALEEAQRSETGALEHVLTDAAQRLERLERELGVRSPGLAGSDLR
jgi:hypothetical protein